MGVLWCALASLHAWGFTAPLPDLPPLTVPAPEPAAPSGWDTFAPPIGRAAPAVGSPTAAEWTRTGGPSDTLALALADLAPASREPSGAAVEFLVYSQTASTDGHQTLANLQVVDEDRAAITLPASLPAGMYLVWPKNRAGVGRPFAINRTEAWWLGFDANVGPGDVVSVYGRNLASLTQTQRSWVYLKRPGVTGTWAHVVSANPYRVQFTAPDSLAAGTYEVWVHNGHGERYGWSAPLTLTIAAKAGWTGATFNVRDYGAVGDGVADDSDAIRRAREAAEASTQKNPGRYPTVYFPAGTYAVHAGIQLQSNTRYLGAGRDRTIIRCSPQFRHAVSSAKLGILYANGGVLNNVEVAELTLDANGNFEGSDHFVRLQTDVGTSDIRFHHVVVRALQRDLGAAFFLNVTRLTLEGCDFLGAHVTLFRGRQHVLDRCRFFGANDNGQAIIQRGVSEVSITNCSHADSDPGTPNGHGKGRFLAGNSDYGSQRHVYIGGNVTTNCGPRADAPEINSGETIMCEGNHTKFSGTPTAASPQTVTLRGLAEDPVGETVVISRGRGLGQHRRITAYDAATGMLTVSPQWNVIPDATSVVLVAYSATRWVVYKNHFDGKDDYATRYTAMTAIQPFGGGHEWIGDSNTITHMFTGLYIAGLQQSPGPAHIQPSFFNYFANNTLTDCYVGAKLISDVAGATHDGRSAVFGTVLRRNRFRGMSVAGIGFETAPANAPAADINLSVIEHNQFRDLPVGIDLDDGDVGARVRNTVVHRNVFERGKAQATASIGVDLAKSSDRTLLVANTWSGFQQNTSGSAPYTQLAELPSPPTAPSPIDPAPTPSPISPAPPVAKDILRSSLISLSARAHLGNQMPVQIVGFSITGTQERTVLIRANGPALSGFGVADHLPNPRLTVYAGQEARYTNRNWSDVSAQATAIEGAAAKVGAFAWTRGSRDAAALITLPPGSYTVHVSDEAGATGVSLIEVYDAGEASADSRLSNLSARAESAHSERTLIAGFVVRGTAAKRVLIRANGPSLVAYQVAGLMADPMLTLHGSGSVIAENDDWSRPASGAAEVAQASAAAGAFAWASGSKDAALVVTLPPGAYTAHVRAKDGSAGQALVEVYELPDN